ncbi:MAG: hypothetical protein WC492_00325 [Candidatus Micrarchaeia archaeon]
MNLLLSEPLIKRGTSYSQCRYEINRMESELIDDWKDAPKYQQDALKLSIMLKKSDHPLNGKKSNKISWRVDETPRLAHFIEPAYRLSMLHADLDEVISTLHHDDIEDGLKNVNEIRNALRKGARSDVPTQILSECVVWHVKALSNTYKTPRVRAQINSPSDIYSPKVLSYLNGRLSAEDMYLRDINSLPLAGPRVVKITGDRLHNVQSNLDPKKYLDLIVHSYIKAFRSLNWAKKYHYATGYYTLEAIKLGLERIVNVFGEDAIKLFSIPKKGDARFPKGTDVKFPLDIFSAYDYHKYNKSFEQDEHDFNMVELAGIRSELSIDTMRKLPYMGTKVAVIFAPGKLYYSRVDEHPIEVQLPRRLPSDEQSNWLSLDPASEQGWTQLRSEDVVKEFQKGIDAYKLPFIVELVPSILPGKMGMDSIMLSLKFCGGDSFSGYLEKDGSGLAAQKKYVSIIYDLSDLLRDFLENSFKAKPRGMLFLQDNVMPPQDSYEQISNKLFKNQKPIQDSLFD